MLALSRLVLPLLLALSLGPSKAALTEPHLHLASALVRIDAGVLDPVAAPITQIETLGAMLGDGVVLGELHLSLDGQPSMPFLSPFFYAQEIRITQVDPIALAGSLMVTARVTF